MTSSNNAYDHSSANRKNQPTTENASLMTDNDRAPVKFKVPRRLPKAIAAVYEASVDNAKVNLNRDLRNHPVLAWERQGATSKLNGDAEADAAHAFEGVPLYTREKVTPALLVEQLRQGDTSRVQQLDLDFDGLGDDAHVWEWYRHTGHWQNRLIHGDSAAVMQSLIAKDGLRGSVQMIYFDPPYGQDFEANFQTTTNKLETPEKLDGLPVGDTKPLRAFRDSYINGVHSYLDITHERAVLARELLTDTGSLFCQIGDENVHRLALVLDEVFGPENRVATITWRPTGGSSSKTLPESASYLLWYAKDKERCKYQQLYEQQSPLTIIAEWDRSFSSPRFTDSETTSRKLTDVEKNDKTFAESNEDRIFRGMSLTSQRSSPTRTREVMYRGERYHCGNERQWCVSIHDGDAPVCTPPNDNGARTAASPPCPDPKPCGLCWLGWTGRIDDSGSSLGWKWFLDEAPGRRIDNVWHKMRAPGKKRYVVQTSALIIESCMLMTTDPGDLVLDPTCGSGTTINVAEEWGRRWITIDVSRVAIAVARQKIATSVYPWHRTTDDGTDPAVDFVYERLKYVSAGRLADPDTDWDHPDNVIKLVDQTETERGRKRLASPFTVESHSPYSYLPFNSELPDTSTTQPSATELGLASGETSQTIIEALYRSPICDPSGQTVLEVTDHESWPEAHLVSHGVTCTRPGRDTETTAGLMIVAPDATVTAQQVTRAVAEARRNADGCDDLIAVGFAFDPDVPTKVGACTVHRVIASKDLQIPELSKKGADGGTFTLLGEPDCEVRYTPDGTALTVRLLGCDSYDPSSGAVRETDLDKIDCWMVDTDHDQMSFIARLTYFPNGLRDNAGLKAAMKSLGKELADDAQSHIISFRSQPFEIPPDDHPIAVKVITNTGTEMNAVIHPSDWTTHPNDEDDS